MLQDLSIIENRYQKFITEIINTEIVWCLKSAEGFATSFSNEFEDATVIPFWSHNSYAKLLSKEEWDSYEPVSISLADFLENWLIGMHHEGQIVGADWDANLFGKEMEPLSLALVFADALLMNGKNLVLINYQGVNQYREEIVEALD